MSVVDAFEMEAKVGDEVLIGQAGKGAQELLKGVVTKINKSTVSITCTHVYNNRKWREDISEFADITTLVERDITRKNKCFVITSYAD